MITRSHSNSVVFRHPFELKGIDGVLPPGEYTATISGTVADL